MCGIAGHVGSARLDPERLARCLALMEHRGPDGHAVFEHELAPGRRAYLLHSRLRIIDLDPRSNQPYRIGDHVLTYNGELYNYLEVKDELQQRGERFDTEGDTEVILRALRADGVTALDRCEGMWAFGLYDVTDGSLLLSRDRFGEKPLYIYETDEGLYFGSEVKFIQALSGRRLEVNLDHLVRYLVNGYKSLYKTSAEFLHGVRELPAGSVLRVEADGRQTSERYWEPELAPDERLSFDDAVAATRERLAEAVRIRLRADVPLAFCMSGGVDSNSLISIAQRALGYDVHGFTILNTDERYEEQDLVEQAVRELGIRHTAIPVDTTGFVDKLRQLVRGHDAPVFTITYYAHWLLMQSIADHGYRIAVSGTGADELFTGYFDHHLAYLAEIADDPALHQESLANWRRHIEPLVRNPYLRDPELFARDRKFRDHIYLNAADFAGYLHEPWEEPFGEVEYCDDLLRNRMLNELFEEAVPVILHEDDSNAMYYSIENRSPFLDRQLFESCYRIPTRHLIRDGYGKAVLRTAMRGLVPDAILDNHRKVGFNAPIFSFLDVADPEVREYLLDDSPVFDLVRRDKVEALIGRSNLPNSESKFLFNFLNSKMFLEELER